MVHIFVAEDSGLIKKVIQNVIEEHEVIKSPNSPETVKRFEQDWSEIIFLDIQMTDEKGLGAVYEIIRSNPEAKVDVYKPRPQDLTIKAEEKEKSETKPVTGFIIKEDGLDQILETGLESAERSISRMLHKDLHINIIRKNIAKKDSIIQYVPGTFLGVFYQVSGDADNGVSLIFPLNDILAAAGLFQIDFTIQVGTTQSIINELGNILINVIMGVMNETMHKKFVLGAPAPVTGANLEAQFKGTGKENDDVVILRINFIVEDKTIDSYLVLSAGRIIS